MKIASIEPAGYEDVFNMEVDDTHDYAVENGVIVHNCRYVLMANPIGPRKNILQEDHYGEDPLNLRQANQERKRWWE